MIKVIIVDDEPWALLGLEDGISWADYHMKICYKTTDPEKALSAIIKYRPDVVVTDIEMPNLSGLDLICISRENGISCKFIIFSGYSEFEYAKRAIQYGVFAYLLKPLNKQEFSDVLTLLSKQLKESQAEDDDYIWDDMPEVGLGNITARTTYCVATFYMTASDKLLLDKDLKELTILSRKLGSDKYCYVLNDDKSVASKEINELLTMAGKKYKDYIFCGLSENYNSLDGLEIAVKESNISALGHYLDPDHSIYQPTHSKPEKCQHLIGHFTDAVAKNATKEAELILRDFPDYCIKYELNILDFSYIYNRILSIMEKSLSHKRSNEADYLSYNRIVEIFSAGPQAVVDFLIAYYYETIQVIGRKPEEVSSEPFEQLLLYIKENYNRELSLTYLSEKFFLNMTYICDLFKKNLSTTFSKYLTNLRLERAHMLIQTTDKSLMDIAESVGYRDYYYFIKQFRKKYKVTPGKFRKEMK